MRKSHSLKISKAVKRINTSIVVGKGTPCLCVASEIKSLLGINLISNVVKAIYIAGVRIVIKNPTNRNNLVIDTFKGN